MTESSQMPPGPGVEHERLKPFEGIFQAEVKIWMGPGEPMISSGTMVNSWELGGRYLHQDYTGDRVDGPFPNFAGKGYWGYNTTSNQYEGFWIDNASTTMQMETGSVNGAGNVWTMTSRVKSPQTGEELLKRSVITLIDDNRYTMEAYCTTPCGEEKKTMEIAYQRS